jgi:hypothetical protein
MIKKFFPKWAIDRKNVTRWKKEKKLFIRSSHAQVIFLDRGEPIGGYWDRPLLISEDRGWLFGTFLALGDYFTGVYCFDSKGFVVDLKPEQVHAMLEVMEIFDLKTREKVAGLLTKGKEKLACLRKPRTVESDLIQGNTEPYSYLELLDYSRILFLKTKNQEPAQK